jgi:hypothetical protein
LSTRGVEHFQVQFLKRNHAMHELIELRYYTTKKEMSKRRAGKAGSWYTSNAAQLDAQLTGSASLPAIPALVPSGTALRACAHHLLHLTCSALKSALQPPALATEGAVRQRAGRAGAAIVRLCMLAPSRPCIGLRRACQRCATGAHSAQGQLRAVNPFVPGLRWLQAAKPADGMLPACGVIAPHAGYSYSVRAAAPLPSGLCTRAR